MARTSSVTWLCIAAIVEGSWNKQQDPSERQQEIVEMSKWRNNSGTGGASYGPDRVCFSLAFFEARIRPLGFPLIRVAIPIRYTAGYRPDKKKCRIINPGILCIPNVNQCCAANSQSFCQIQNPS